MHAHARPVHQTLVLVRLISRQFERRCRRYLRLIDPASRVWFHVVGKFAGRKHMKTTRIMAAAVLIAASALAQHAVRAQQAGTKRTDLQRHDLSVPGREVIQVRRRARPGSDGPQALASGRRDRLCPRRLAGVQLEGKPPVTLKAGDVLFIPAGTVHAAKNVGSGPGAELATYIVEKGKPLLRCERQVTREGR